ncbi:glycosyltransferase family 4 protein [Roseibium sp. AS2]|uniref:glycosyltransferase family 4 protein n=1 Tax=Roseibium sp. AS2 TaxID=3135781 RepID=UPI00317A3830
MQSVHFAYPGDLATPSGGYGYDRRIMAGLRKLGWQVEPLPLGDGFPFPSPETLSAAEVRFRALPAGTRVVVDGLAFGALAHAAAATDHLRLVALLHHPLCLENGLAPDRARALLESETCALKHAGHVIVTSPATAAQVHDLFAFPEEKISVVLPGTEKPDTYARPASDVTRLLSVGTLVPRKGYDLLLDALAELPADAGAWHLDIVGGLDSDPACYGALRKQSADLNLSDRIRFHGAVPEDHLSAHYRAAHIFVLASRFEGYGMAYTEALAHGLPVIGSGGGAVRETLPEGAALYCGTEDVAALRAALQRLLTSPEERASLGDAARSAARAFPDWQDAAARFSDILRETGP